MKEELTIADICSEMRCCHDTLKSWIKRGLSPPSDVKRGVRKLWRRETVNAALEKMPRRPAMA